MTVMFFLTSVFASVPQKKSVIIYDFDNDNPAKTKYFLEPEYKGTWLHYPIWITATNTVEERIGRTGKSQRIEWNNKGMNCRWSARLYSINPTKYNCLTFWIKGRDGKENFDIELSDDQIYKYRIEPLNIGSINTFLKSGISKQWQKVKIPLSILEGQVNLTSLDMIGFLFKYKIEGNSSAVFIDDINFENDPDMDFIEKLNLPKSIAETGKERSIWVWRIDPVTDLWVRKKLFDLCKLANIKTCFVYFGDFNINNIIYLSKLKDFLGQAHNLNIKIHILESDPTWALQVYHNCAINWIKPFLDYNKSQPPKYRFDGCAFDVEPYLNSQWQKYPKTIKMEYINLLRKMKIFISGYEDANFKLGIPIPFFYEDEGDFEEKVLKYADYAVVMSYYDSAKKVIEVSRYHLTLAEKLRTPVYIGVETEDLMTNGKGRRQNTFFEEGWDYMESTLAKVNNEFEKNQWFAGFAIHHYTSYKSMPKEKNVPTKDRPLPNQTPVFEAPHTAGDIIIDGNIGDWDKTYPVSLDNLEQVVDYGKTVWRGVNDYSLKAYAMWDESNVYFAFDVTDDKPVQDKVGQDIWEGDHIELWFDSDLIEDYNDAVNSDDDFQFGFSPGNFSLLPPETFIFAPEQDSSSDWQNNIEIASIRKDNGYTIEVKISIEMFKEILTKSLLFDNIGSNKAICFKEGMMFGFLIDGSDTDNLTMPQKLLISSSKERIWGDPTTFGIIKLKKSLSEK